MSTQLSSRTWPIRSVQLQNGSVAHPKYEPPLRAASGSQEDPEHRRAELNSLRTIPLTMETLAAHGEDSLQRLRRRVEASIARSACPASSSTVLELVPKNKRTYEGGWASSCSTKSTTSPPLEKMDKYLLMLSGRRPKTEMSFFIYIHGGHSITTETTESTRTPESKASRPADNGSSSPRAHPSGSESYGRTFCQTSIRIGRPGCDSSVRGCQG